MVKTKSILKKSKGKKHTKRVHFMKSKKGKKVKTMKGKKHMKNIKKKNKKKTRKHKKNNGKRSMRRKLKIKMKGGCGIGAKLTGVAYNSDPQHQYPESTNLNSNTPSSFQKGGSLWDTFGLGDVPLIKNHLINASKNVINTVTGNSKVVSADPTVHPHMEKSLITHPQHITDLKKVHQANVVQQ